MTNTRFSGIRHRFRPWFIVWLVVMWCMLMGEITVGNVVGGLLVALVISGLNTDTEALRHRQPARSRQQVSASRTVARRDVGSVYA